METHTSNRHEPKFQPDLIHTSREQLSQQLIDHSLNITWWGNVRFEQAFDAETATLMAKAGCVALSGGLEVASNRLLKLMNKGVSVEQVARGKQNSQYPKEP
jgi:radical SAM superfamily enzyme YgiQ (UPF0313 family)